MRMKYWVFLLIGAMFFGVYGGIDYYGIGNTSGASSASRSDRPNIVDTQRYSEQGRASRSATRSGPAPIRRGGSGSWDLASLAQNASAICGIASFVAQLGVWGWAGFRNRQSGEGFSGPAQASYPANQPNRAPSQENVYVVGRDPSHAHICLDPSLSGISRQHLQITVTPGERYVIQDLDSRNGTKLFQGGEWKRILRATVNGDDPLSLAGHKTTVRKLLSQLG